MPVFRISYLYLLPAFIRPMFNISLICYILPAFIMPFTSLASSPVFIVTSFILCCIGCVVIQSMFAFVK